MEESIRIEKVAYTESCSDEIKQALKDRVYVFEPGIIYFKQIPLLSPFSMQLMFEELFRLGSTFEKWGVILDLRDGSKPDAKTRRVINEVLHRMADETEHLSILTKGLFLNTVIRFVMYGIDMKSLLVSTNYDQVLEAVRKAVR